MGYFPFLGILIHAIGAILNVEGADPRVGQHPLPRQAGARDWHSSYFDSLIIHSDMLILGIGDILHFDMLICGRSPVEAL
mmetsp:Transcript_110694/g.344957  ORF Transcript_110694/g.344957 Transcript_110694/m.344957 type:complete len:80 (-) Transcript_110694:115-354(-)